MRFCLLDRICSLEPGVEVTAVKAVSLAEEYLADHFPEFPVLPGVFMLQAATEAATWLVRVTDNYAHSMIELAEARSVKFTGFVAPGHELHINVEILKREGSAVDCKFQGEVDDRVCVSGRLTLRCSNLADEDPALAELDARMIAHQRHMEPLLIGAASLSGSPA
jgi:3-hydroxyacyl-[acyl-carrier-protein] dehydratase